MLRPALPYALACTWLSLALAACGGGGSNTDGGGMDAAADAGGGDAGGDGGGDASGDGGGDAVVDAGPPRLVQLSGNASVGHNCALRNDGTVWCWGLNDHGQLGVAPGSSPDTCVFTSSGGNTNFPCATHPQAVAGIADAVAVTAGNGHTCALKSDGTVWCWGVNDVGQLGTGTHDASAHPTPTMVLSGAKSVSAGAFHTCAAMTDGTVKCWGNAQYGQTGADPMAAGATMSCVVDVDTFPCSPTPNAVPGITMAAEVTGGRYHNCARTMDGHVQCWGLNDVSQLGTTNDTVPHFMASAPFLANVTQVSAGGSHACAVTDDHAVHCWGWADLGQIGIAASATSTCMPGGEMFQCAQSPAIVPGVQAVAVAAMRSQTCSVAPDGTASCWGRNDNGQLGIGASSPDTCADGIDVYPCARAPYPVLDVTDAVGIAGGDYHACVLRAAGGASCWGWNVYGQLGNGATTDQNAPVAVMGLP